MRDTMAAMVRVHRAGAPDRQDSARTAVPPLLEAKVSRVDAGSVFAVADVHDPHNEFGPLSGDTASLEVGDLVLIAVLSDPTLTSTGVWLIARGA